VAALNPPSFEEWVDECFRHKRPESGTYYSGFVPTANVEYDHDELAGEIYAPLLAAYMTRLFDAPGFIANRFTDDEIAAGTHFLFGAEAGCLRELRGGGVSPGVFLRCLRSVGTLYTDLFDRVCGTRGQRPDEEFKARIDSAVYMIWDTDSLDYAVTIDWPDGPCTEAGFTILEAALMRCRTSACRQSALHGIGHLMMQRPCEGDVTIRDRLRGLVDRFLHEKQPPEWLAEYAREARAGRVM
jgi:hypothetical protein